MPRKDSQASKPPPGLRMKALMEATGLPKSTLLFYVEQGLLPPPVKTSPNMAFYSPECVERAALIRELQSKHNLPLAKIKAILDARDRGEDIAPLVALSQAVLGERKEPLLSREELCRKSGLTPQQVAELEKLQLLLPLTDQGYDAQDLSLARILAKAKSEGIEPSDLAFYPRLGKKLVDEEFKLRHRLTHDMPPDKDAARTLEMVQRARAMRSYVIDRIFQRRVITAKGIKDPGLLK